MPAPVRMRLGDHAFMGVLMMRIVHMPVFVLDRLVHVVVAMAFGQMQPEAKSHQRAGADQLSRERSLKRTIAMSAPRNGASEK
jgi:hypothetical protein